MTDLRKAAEMALDALDSCEFDYDWEERPYKTFDEDLVNDAVDALRQALDHVPDTMKMLEPDMGIDRGAWDDVPDATKWVDELRGGDETEQEPVAWWNPRYGKGEYAFAEEQSPPDDSNDPSDFGWNIPLYTAPPKRKWKGLTDEEIGYIWGITKPDYEDLFDFPRAIEAKLREKNGL